MFSLSNISNLVQWNILTMLDGYINLETPRYTSIVPYFRSLVQNGYISRFLR
jgi:hypothetical protein